MCTVEIIEAAEAPRCRVDVAVVDTGTARSDDAPMVAGASVAARGARGPAGSAAAMASARVLQVPTVAEGPCAAADPTAMGVPTPESAVVPATAAVLPESGLEKINRKLTGVLLEKCVTGSGEVVRDSSDYPVEGEQHRKRGNKKLSLRASCSVASDKGAQVCGQSEQPRSVEGAQSAQVHPQRHGSPKRPAPRRDERSPPAPPESGGARQGGAWDAGVPGGRRTRGRTGWRRPGADW
ncbi:unnamed protein product [Closterium sp. NIES-53]